MHTRASRRPLWLVALGLAVAYFVTARLGLSLALPPDYKATAVWLPSGLALAAAFLTRLRAWPGVWAGAFAANLWDAFAPDRRGPFDAHLISSAAIATGSTLQAVAGAFLIRRFVGPEGVLTRARDAFRFVTIIPGACLLAATAGVGALAATGLVPWAAAPTVWWTWWVGDTAGALVVAPVVLCAARCERLRVPPAESVVLFVLLAGCCAFVFGGWGPSATRAAPLAYLSLPFLVWAAIRFGPRGAALAVVLIAAFAVWGTVNGAGPFVHTDVYQSLLLLDVFLAVLVVTSLLLGAVLREREAAEAALRASEAKFRQLAEALPQIVWATNPDGATAYLNRRWTEYTGLTAATPADLAQAVHPDDLPRLAAAGDIAQGTGAAFQEEFRLRSGTDGAYRWFLARSVPVVGPDGAPAGRLGTSTDIDDLKRAQAELAQQKAELQLILDTVPALIFFKDREHRLVRVNNELVRVMGLPLDAIVGRTDSELGSPHADGYRVHEEEIMRTGATRTVVEPLHTFAGTRWLQTTKLPYRDAAGRVAGVLGFSVDITDQKRAEEEVRRLNAELERRVAERTAELRVSEERFALAVRGSQDGIWDWDLRTGAVYYSPRWKQMLGYEEHEVAPRAEEWQRLLHPDDRPAAEAALAAYFDRTADGFGLEVRMRHKDGTYRWIYTRGVARFGPGGRPDRMGGSHTDVTDRKEAEAALRASNELLDSFFEAPGSLRGVVELIDGDIVHLRDNAEAAAFFGRSPEEMRDRRASAMGVSAEAIALWSGHYRESRRLGNPGQFEFAVPGGGRWLQATVSPLTAGAGERYSYVAWDVTARRAAEGALRESEERFRGAFDHAPIGIALVSPEGRWLKVNQAMCQMFGRRADELLVTDFQALTHPDDLGTDLALAGQVLRGERATYQLEKRYVHKDGHVISALLAVSLVRAPGGAPLYFVAHVKDISERKRAEHELRESRQQLALALEAAQAGVWSLDLDARTFAASEPARALHGVAPGEPLDHDGAFLRVHPDDRPRVGAALQRTLEAGDRYQVEYRVAGTADRWLAAFAEVQPGPAGPRLVGLVQDVSERRRAEEALRESEARFRSILDHSPAVVYLKDLSGRYLFVNRRCGELLAIPPEAWVGRTAGELVAPQLAAQFEVNDRRVCETLRAQEVEEFAVVPGRGLVTLLSVQFPLFRPDGEPYAICGISSDITERQRAEEALRGSEERYRETVEAAPDAIVTTDARGTILGWNRGAERVFGWAAGEAVGRDVGLIVPPAYLAACRAAMAAFDPDRHRARGRLLAVAARRKSGGAVPVEIALAHWGAGADRRFTAIIRDVTERNRAEHALRESEERFRVYSDHSADALFVHDADGRVADVNRQACASLGYERDELIGRLPTDFDPDFDPVGLAALNARLSAGETVTFDSRHRRKDGTRFPVEIRIRPFRTATGLMKLAAVRDVTERKRAEHALRVSEERFRVLFEHSSDAHLIFDEADGILDCNRAAVDMLRYPDKGAVLALHPAVLSPEFQPDGRRSLEKCVEMDATARRAGYHRFDWLHQRADGETFPCEVTLTPVALGGRTVLLTVWHDLTERHRAEAALRASEERYRTVVQALAEGVAVQDRDGVIVTCNDRAPEILGLTRDQLAGRTSLDPRWRAVREDGSPFPGEEHPAMEVLRTGVPQSNVIMGVHTPEGDLRWVSINAAPVPGADPAGAAVVCSFHDVTAVREANDRLRASVREKEAMLKEIHHRVKNNLQIISTLLDLQSDGLTDPAARAAFRESRSRVRSMSLIHERLYRSENLASVEFGAYLRGLADDLFRAYRADDEAIRLEVAVSAPPLPLDVAIPCGLLANELLSNCLKYAFAGREGGIISVSLERAGGGPFVLTVADDGVGLPAGFDLQRPTSFGLQLAGTLAEQLGGALAVGGGPGARFVVRFPGRG